MGLIGYDAVRLCEAHERGVRFDTTLIIGRLNLYLHPGELRSLVRRFPTARRALTTYAFGDYADPFLRECLGVQSLTVLDQSDYEGATRTHDLNRPIPDDLVERFDVVIDAGSLEHVFNFPVAAANLMNALKVGGTLFMTTPANNLCGHGFYQFSPELLYRAFGPSNGFEVRRLAALEARFPAVESTPVRRVRLVPDPAETGRRIGLRTSRPILLALEAEKTARVIPFEECPQQSDYVARWRAPDRSYVSWARRVFDRLPGGLRARVLGLYHLWEYSFQNRAVFRSTRTRDRD